ncbi:MAG: DUF1700 domain-containing protein [Lachnospiraceae bacterium]|jgi:Predicted membrane protein
MNCEEFLRQFHDALEGKVSESLIQENINYYRSYIDSQTATGRSESDVLYSLGDPRLLAKTIEESRKFASESRSGADYRNFSSSHTYTENDRYTDDNGEKLNRIPRWLITCIVVVVVLLILSGIFRMFVFLAPYIIVCILTIFLFRAVRNWWQGK